MACRLVIFDCDGVLFESRAANEAFYNHIRAHFGLPPLNLKELDYVHMATAQDAVDFIIPDTSLRPLAQAYRLTVNYQPYNRFMVMEPSLLDLLEFLRPRRKTAVCTNRSTTIGPLLRDFGLAGYFDLVVSCLDVARPKPAPDPVLLILDRLKTAPEDALYIGDSTSDAQAAEAAGVPLVAYRNPDLDARYHIHDLAEVKTIVTA
ncbi:MAG: HAD family hydrolase [Thermodesulfobacteriota bacterium]